MMTEQRTINESGLNSFQTSISNIFNNLDDRSALKKLRAKAFDHYLKLGLPTRKNDVYKYVKLHQFFANNYEVAEPVDIEKAYLEPYILPECKQSVLVFVNGYFSLKLSKLEALPKNVATLTIEEAMNTYGAFLNSRYLSSLKTETDAFAAINAAVHGNGLFLYLPPKTILKSPLQILNIIDAKDSSMLVMPRVQAFIGADSEVKLVSTKAIISGFKYSFNMVTDLNIEERAHVKYLQTVDLKDSPVWHFEAIRATQKKNSTLKTIEINNGSATVRFDYRVSLTGENAEACLNGFCMLSGKNESHTHVLIEHEAPNCRSNQLFKSALDDESHSSFEGKILVRQAAQKTEAFQLNNNLLLSDKANAESKPNLEIFADDVKASHGSTFGQLDTDQIFYMKTRGFNTQDAKNLLVYGFCQEVLNMAFVPSIHKQLKLQALEFYTKS